MTSIVALMLKLSWFYLPAGVANIAPVAFKNRFKRLAVPIDGGMRFRGKRLLGDHKTWRGLILGTICGGMFFATQYALAAAYPAVAAWYPFDVLATPWYVGFAIAAGALLGDMLKSFFKRQVGIPSGHPWFPFDQMDFLLGATAIIALIYPLTLTMFLLVVAVGPFMHVLVKFIGFKLQIDDKPI